jgi:hypothetical protein
MGTGGSEGNPTPSRYFFIEMPSVMAATIRILPPLKTDYEKSVRFSQLQNIYREFEHRPYHLPSPYYHHK